MNWNGKELITVPDPIWKAFCVALVIGFIALWLWSGAHNPFANYTEPYLP
jgi:hypothetical protein